MIIILSLDVVLVPQPKHLLIELRVKLSKHLWEESCRAASVGWTTHTRRHLEVVGRSGAALSGACHP